MIIANALCFLPDIRTAPNVKGDARISLREVFLRNSWVSLWSAGRFHPDSKRYLLTNVSIGDDEQRFSSIGAEVKVVPWQRYMLPETYPWRMAYYKLNALEWLAEHQGKSLLLDVDAFFVSSIKDLIEEAPTGLFLFDTQHRFHHPFRTEIRNLQNDLLVESQNPIHYGGEAVFREQTVLKTFTEEFSRIFDSMTSQLKIFTPEQDQGDEVVLSIAADRLVNSGKITVRPINPYLNRY